MAYQLQPGLSIVENAGALPSVKATDEVFVYPQPSQLNYGSRPNTMLYGTAPYRLVRVLQQNISKHPINFVPKLLPVSIRSSYPPMNAIYSPSPTWIVKSLFVPGHTNLRVLVPSSRMVCLTRGILIKMLTRSKNG